MASGRSNCVPTPSSTADPRLALPDAAYDVPSTSTVSPAFIQTGGLSLTKGGVVTSATDFDIKLSAKPTLAATIKERDAAVAEGQRG